MGAGSRASVTLEQVARAAGVSRATASRVLSGNPAVSPEARLAVERAAYELGYILNRAARSLAAGQSAPTGRSQSIGIVILEPTSEFFGDPKFSRLLTGIGEELSARSLQLVLFAPQSPTDVSRLENYLAGGHVDAVIVLAHRDLDSAHSPGPRGFPSSSELSPRTTAARASSTSTTAPAESWRPSTSSSKAGVTSPTSPDRHTSAKRTIGSRDSGRRHGRQDSARTWSSTLNLIATGARWRWRDCWRERSESTQ